MTREDQEFFEDDGEDRQMEDERMYGYRVCNMSAEERDRQDEEEFDNEEYQAYWNLSDEELKERFRSAKKIDAVNSTSKGNIKIKGKIYG